jgi:hypothetical protein
VADDANVLRVETIRYRRRRGRGLSVPWFVGYAFAAIVALVLLKRTKFFWIPVWR